MATPSIQTLITQAQQVLNLQSSNEIRATLAAVLANANVGTPLNPNLTTQQLWNEFGEIVRQSTDDIMSIVVDQMMRMVFSPPAPGGAGADKQVIFNDGGVLAGDAGLTYNKATDALTITGALTVDSPTLVVNAAGYADRVGIGTATPASALSFPIGTVTAVGMTAVTAHLPGNVSTLKFGVNDGGGDFGGVHVFNTHNGTYSSSEVGIFTGEGGISVPTQRLRVNKTGDVSISTGNLVMATSGKGIDFSAVTGGTGTATGNVLKDYEEGTWVPGVGGDATYTLRRGNYVKVGRLVTVSWDMEILLIGTGDVSGIISLPFVVGDASGVINFPGYGSTGFFNVLTTTVYSMSFYAAANTSIIYAMTKNSLSAGNSVNTAIYGNGTRVQGSLTYMTNS
jgi:hypothetical protein